VKPTPRLEFRLVRHDQPLPQGEALDALAQRRPPERLKDHRQAAADYRIDEPLEIAVNMALAVGEPLLVTGKPGTGKTQLAWFLGSYFGIAVRPFFVKSTSSARDLHYDFDAVGYLQAAYAAQHGAEPRQRQEFLQPGPLWQAYADPRPSVLLIDEIDKAPRDFPNDLLHELDQAWFPHPFRRDEQDEPVRVEPESGRPPLVVITSNVERRLPAPFLRRCIFHHIELTEALVERAVDSRAEHYRGLDPAIRKAAVERFWELHGMDLQKPPSTAELLLWLAILHARGVTAKELAGAPAGLPALGALIKVPEDLEILRG
jgi:MoxR-like ATPase